MYELSHHILCVDYDRNGYLSPGEVWGGLQFLGLHSLNAQDVLDFVAYADMDVDGNLSFKEFIEVLHNPLCEEESTYQMINNSRDEESSPPSRAASASSSMLPHVPLKRQLSMSAVPPVGEEELKDLLYCNQKEEEREENLVEISEKNEEQRIQRELEEEEILQNIDQDGGQNPKITSETFMIQYNFKTGKLPRYVTSRGDYAFKTDHDNTSSDSSSVDGTVYFTKVFQSSMLFVSLPPVSADSDVAYVHGGVGSLGGVGLNQYTAIIEVMFESMPQQPVAGGPSTAIPVFSTAAYGERDALVWLHHNGALSNSPISSMGRNYLPRIQANQWTCVSIVVDGGHPDGSLALYVGDNEACCLRISPDGIDEIDNVAHCIVENRITLLGSKDLKVCQGGCLRSLTVIPRVLIGAEVSELVRGIIKESNSNIVGTITAQLMSMGFTEDIAYWAASNSTGESVEDRVMNAFNILSQEG